jgi:hypothetical protein
VPVGGEVLAEDAAEVDLRGAVRRAVVVGQVDVRDAEVEGPAQDRPLGREGLVVTEVVPQSERDLGQLEPAAPGPPVAHVVVASRGGEVPGERVHGPT